MIIVWIILGVIAVPVAAFLMLWLVGERGRLFGLPSTRAMIRAGNGASSSGTSQRNRPLLEPLHAYVYARWTNEYIVPQSTAKYTKRTRESLMVGALARYNINHEKLKPMAKKVADALGLKAPCYNPYMNTVAQYVECLHTIEDSIDIIDDLLKTGVDYDEVYPQVTPKAGQGVGAVEVPRGLLLHDYTYDENGICTKANCIIPTNQNHANIQLDMEKLVPEIMSKPKNEVELTLEMLVRAYDPCISCSTHYLKVEFKDE